MSDGTSEATVRPKRAAKKRASGASARNKADGSSAVPRKRAARKRATRKKTTRKADPISTPKEEKIAPKETTTDTSEQKRKAPTNIASDAKTRKAGRIRLIIVSVLLMIGVGSSAAVGFTDRGSIDVNQIIDERNSRVQSSGSGERLVPQQNTTLEPDGGLIGGTPSTVTPTPAPVEEVATGTATSTATSTDSEAATSSEEVAAEESVPLPAGELESEEAATTSSDS